MKKEDILSELRIRGYTIDVTEKDNSNRVTLNSNTATKGYKLSRSYSKEYSKYEVQLDCVNDMLAWSGLKVTETLDYR